MRYVKDVHRPIRMIVLSVAPLSFIAIAPPARRLCDDTLSTVYPVAMRQSYVAPHRTAAITSQLEIRVVRVGGRHTVLNGVEARMPACQSCNRTNLALKCIMVHKCALHAILGVGNRDGSTVCSEEGGEPGVMVEELAFAP